MSLVNTIAALRKAPVSAEEAAHFNAFQKHFDIDGDDPLIVVLAMMANSQTILEQVPELLQQKSKEMIELHQIVLRKQAGVIANELITDVAALVQQATKPWRTMWIWFAACFGAGLITAAALFYAALQFHR